MRVRYVKSSDLGVIESTVNLLLSEGWERDSMLLSTPDGEWLITMINYDRPVRGLARAADISSYRAESRNPIAPPPEWQEESRCPEPACRETTAV